MKKGHPKAVTKQQYDGNSTTAQRHRLIEALRAIGSNGLTTIQIREQLDIMMPAARVHELRWKLGYNIQEIRDHDENAQGNRHTCSRYVLMAGRWPRPRGASNG